MNQNKSFESLQIKEMQIRNYSPRTIDTYCKLLCNLEKELGKSLYEITTEDFKTKLHFMITQKGSSTSTINQLISAFKIFYVDVCHREWREFHVKRPRTEKKADIPYSRKKHSKSSVNTSTHRVAFSNHRIIDYKDAKVSFNYKDYKSDGTRKTMTLEVLQILSGKDPISCTKCNKGKLTIIPNPLNLKLEPG